MVGDSRQNLTNRALEVKSARQKELDLIPVELQVIDCDHARSDQVITYCKKAISEGLPWEELRRRLGLGPAAQDKRWRVVRATIIEQLVPKSDEEAMRLVSEQRHYLIQQVDDFKQEVEDMMKASGTSEEEIKNIPAMLKIRLESMRTLLDHNDKTLQAYVAVKRAKEVDKLRQGTSIIIQNNYHVARPGQNPRMIGEMKKEVAQLVESSKKESE